MSGKLYVLVACLCVICLPAGAKAQSFDCKRHDFQLKSGSSGLACRPASQGQVAYDRRSPHGFRALSIAIGASHINLPAEATRHAQCLDFHENESGTFGRVVKPTARN